MGGINSKSQIAGYEDGSLEINLSNFKLLRVVGKGSYGKVRVVELKNSESKVKETFALKYIRKIDCVRADFAHNIIRERRILQELEHPLIVNLRYAFQDEEFMYMVSDLMLGGDLRFHINRKTFTEEAIRFWIAEVGCALRYLHSRGIVHRDVKPDNILLDSEGHAHLADFNVASYLQPNRKLTGRSGTAAYMAPEVYSGVGYATSPDWFSLGVTFYECVYGRLPFDADKGDSLSRQIQYTDPQFPQTSPPVSNLCIMAISNLLERDHNIRIGASSWSSFTDQPFFQDLDFRLLELKRIPPVFRPSQEKSNFDAVYELEELLLEQAPLEGRARKAAKKHHQANPRGQSPAKEGTESGRAVMDQLRKRPRGNLSEEEREEEILEMLNQFFEPYDYTRHKANPQSLATLTKEIRRLSLTGTITPGTTPPNLSSIPGGIFSGENSPHESIPIQQQGHSPSYRSDTSGSPTPEADHHVSPPSQRYPTPPPQSQIFLSSSPPQLTYPNNIRPPPAVARIAGKEKRKTTSNNGHTTYPSTVPTSHPVIPQKESAGISGIMPWGKNKDTKNEKVWEPGVIGRERARVIIDGKK